jgi:hypothetical protein
MSDGARSSAERSEILLHCLPTRREKREGTFLGCSSNEGYRHRRMRASSRRTGFGAGLSGLLAARNRHRRIGGRTCARAEQRGHATTRCVEDGGLARAIRFTVDASYGVERSAVAIDALAVVVSNAHDERRATVSHRARLQLLCARAAKALLARARRLSQARLLEFCGWPRRASGRTCIGNAARARTGCACRAASAGFANLAARAGGCADA